MMLVMRYVLILIIALELNLEELGKEQPKCIPEYECVLKINKT